MFSLMGFSLADFVVENWGIDKWYAICESIGHVNPEEVLVGGALFTRAAQAACSELNVDEDGLGDAFVRFFANNTMKKSGYMEALRYCGTNVVDMVDHFNDFHLFFRGVGAEGVDTWVGEVEPDSFKMHIRSYSQLTSSFLARVVEHIQATHFDQNVTVELIKARDDPDCDHEVFLVRDASGSQAFSPCVQAQEQLQQHASLSAFSMNAQTFYTMFPFHFIIGLDCQLVQVGSALQHMFPDLERPGVTISEFFEIMHPSTSQWSFPDLVRNSHAPRLMLLSSDTGFTLQGCFFPTQMPISDRKVALFVGSPRVNGLDDLESYGLGLSDMPFHMDKESILKEHKLEEHNVQALVDTIAYLESALQEAHQTVGRLQGMLQACASGFRQEGTVYTGLHAMPMNLLKKMMLAEPGVPIDHLVSRHELMKALMMLEAATAAVGMSSAPTRDNLNSLTGGDEEVTQSLMDLLSEPRNRVLQTSRFSAGLEPVSEVPDALKLAGQSQGSNTSGGVLMNAGWVAEMYQSCKSSTTKVSGHAQDNNSKLITTNSVNEMFLLDTDPTLLGGIPESGADPEKSARASPKAVTGALRRRPQACMSEHQTVPDLCSSTSAADMGQLSSRGSRLVKSSSYLIRPDKGSPQRQIAQAGNSRGSYGNNRQVTWGADAGAPGTLGLISTDVRGRWLHTYGLTNSAENSGWRNTASDHMVMPNELKMRQQDAAEHLRVGDSADGREEAKAISARVAGNVRKSRGAKNKVKRAFSVFMAKAKAAMHYIGKQIGQKPLEAESGSKALSSPNCNDHLSQEDALGHGNAPTRPTPSGVGSAPSDTTPSGNGNAPIHSTASVPTAHASPPLLQLECWMTRDGGKNQSAMISPRKMDMRADLHPSRKCLEADLTSMELSGTAPLHRAPPPPSMGNNFMRPGCFTVQHKSQLTICTEGDLLKSFDLGRSSGGGPSAISSLKSTATLGDCSLFATVTGDGASSTATGWLGGTGRGSTLSIPAPSPNRDKCQGVGGPQTPPTSQGLSTLGMGRRRAINRLHPLDVKVESVLKMVKGPEDELAKCLAGLDSWQMDVFKLDAACNNRVLSVMAFALFQRAGLISTFKLDPTKLARLLVRLEEGYGSNPYHSRVHAADVLQKMHATASHGGLWESAVPSYTGVLPDLASYVSTSKETRARVTKPNNGTQRQRVSYADEVATMDARLDSSVPTGEPTPIQLLMIRQKLVQLTVYLAAVIHDFGHKGVNNHFLIRSGDPLALLYNDVSPMENHHVAAAFTLMKEAVFNFLGPLPSAVRDQIRSQVIDMVLSTDMKQHFSLTAQFSAKVSAMGMQAGASSSSLGQLGATTHHPFLMRGAKPASPLWKQASSPVRRRSYMQIASLREERSVDSAASWRQATTSLTKTSGDDKGSQSHGYMNRIRLSTVGASPSTQLTQKGVEERSASFQIDTMFKNIAVHPGPRRIRSGDQHKLLTMVAEMPQQSKDGIEVAEVSARPSLLALLKLGSQSVGSNNSYSPVLASALTRSESSCVCDAEEPPPPPVDDDTKFLLWNIALKVADLGHLTNEKAVHMKWVGLLEEELFRQGDLEQSSGMPVSALMDRRKAGITRQQPGFFNAVLLPLLTTFTQSFPETYPLLSGALANLKMWSSNDGDVNEKE